MAIADIVDCKQQIGATAGEIWHLLSQDGPMALTKLVKAIDAPRDLTMQAIGWLAREDKITVEENGRSRMIALAE